MPVHRLAKYATADPFTRIPNAAICDPDLDLKAIGLLVVMLSKPNDWRFTERNLAESIGVGRRQLATAMQTLIDAGYVRRSWVAEAGTTTLVTEVYDAKLAEGPETAPLRMSRNADFAKRELRETGPPSNNGDLLTTETALTTESVATPTSDAAADGWQQASELCDYLADAIVESGGPGTRRPKVTRQWIETMERLARIDERTPDQIRAAIDWTHRADPSSNGAWWSDKVLSPDALRRHYEKMRRQASRNGHHPAKLATTLDDVAAELERRGQ